MCPLVHPIPFSATTEHDLVLLVLVDVYATHHTTTSSNPSGRSDNPCQRSATKGSAELWLEFLLSLLEWLLPTTKGTYVQALSSRRTLLVHLAKLQTKAGHSSAKPDKTVESNATREDHFDLVRLVSNKLEDLCQSPMDLDDLLTSVSLHVSGSNPTVQEDSVMGKFILKHVNAFEGMDFTSYCQIYDAFTTWERDGKSLSNRFIDSSYPPFHAITSSLLMKQSNQDFVDIPVQFLKPKDLPTQLPKGAVDFIQAATMHPSKRNAYLQFVYHAEKGEFQLALDHLLCFGDLNQQQESNKDADTETGQSKTTAHEILWKSKHFTLILLASLYSRFDHTKEALKYIHDAIPLAREAGDAESLHYLQCWLSRYTPIPETDTIPKSALSELWYKSAKLPVSEQRYSGLSSSDVRFKTIAALNLLDRAGKSVEAGHSPRHVFETLLQSQILDPMSHHSSDIRSKTWAAYGNEELAEVYERRAHDRRQEWISNHRFQESNEPLMKDGPLSPWNNLRLKGGIPDRGENDEDPLQSLYKQAQALYQQGMSVSALFSLFKAVKLVLEDEAHQSHLIALPYLLTCLALSTRFCIPSVEDWSYVLLSRVMQRLGMFDQCRAMISAVFPRLLASAPHVTSLADDKQDKSEFLVKGNQSKEMVAEAWLILAECEVQNPMHGDLSQALAWVEEAESLYKQGPAHYPLPHERILLQDRDQHMLGQILARKAYLCHDLGRMTARNAAAKELRSLLNDA